MGADSWQSRRYAERPNGLELSCPAEAGRSSLIVAPASGPGTPHYPPARRVSFSELLGSPWTDRNALPPFDLTEAKSRANF